MNCNTDNVVFFQHPHDVETQNGDSSGASAISCEHLQSTPKEIEVVPRNESLENQYEYSRKDQVAADIASMTRTKLRETYPRTYSSWGNMKTRCRKGKGELHPDFDQFPDFLALMGPRPTEDHSVDRDDHSLPDYSPDNCRWLSKAGQTANRRNTRKLIDAQGTRNAVAEWSRIWGVPSKTILQRVDRDRWSHDDAIKTPVGGKRPAKKTTTTTAPKSLFPETAPAHLQPIYSAWVEGFVAISEGSEFVLEWKHIRQLEYIQQGFYQYRVPAVHVVRLVVSKWHDFAEFVHYGYGSPPYLPDLAFLKAHLDYAVETYLFDGGERLPDESEPTTPTTPATPIDPEQDL